MVKAFVLATPISGPACVKKIKSDNLVRLDSAQLVKYIDSDKFKSLSDLGTGAGFPGIILSIFFSDVISFHVKLYEKSNVKIDFLKEQKQKLNLNNVSLYDNDYQSHKLSSDYFVFRAFKKLHEILRISRETIIGPHKLIIMMGKSAQDLSLIHI